LAPCSLSCRGPGRWLPCRWQTRAACCCFSRRFHWPTLRRLPASPPRPSVGGGSFVSRSSFTSWCLEPRVKGVKYGCRGADALLVVARESADAIEQAFQSRRFRASETVILQVQVVDHLRDCPQRHIRRSKALRDHFR